MKLANTSAQQVAGFTENSKLNVAQALDKGLEDMKKIQAQNKKDQQTKTKLTDLRPDRDEGEKLRIDNNFNKDVLQLKKANDVLKSKVKIQKDEIKALKDTIETKLQRENKSMLSYVAPVFKNYLYLDIENVVQEKEHNEKIYYTII